MWFAQLLTLLIFMYLHILAPSLPQPLLVLLRNPIIRTSAIFWLVFQKTGNWRVSGLIAVTVISALECIGYFWYGREGFCDMHWYDAVTGGKHKPEKRVEDFLDRADEFIKNIYEYVGSDNPDSVK